MENEIQDLQINDLDHEQILDNFGNDLYGFSDDDLYDVENALPIQQQPLDAPAYLAEESEFLALIEEVEQAKTLSEFNLFLLEKYKDLTQQARLINPEASELTSSSIFDKNTQTQWFSEFNNFSQSSGQEYKKLICKKNGYFYNESDLEQEDNIFQALVKNGVPESEASTLKNSFQFTFMGNTSFRDKDKSAGKSIKTYVLQLKEPYDQDQIKAHQDVMEYKKALVHKYIDKHYNLETAIEKISERASSLVDQDKIKNKGVEPYTGSGNAMFLHKYATFQLLSEIPEIKDQFKVVPLDAEGNKITYSGYSETLDSYFDSELSLHKIVTKDEKKLPQKELERIVDENIRHLKKPIVEIKAQNDNVLIKNHVDKAAENSQNLADKSNTPDISDTSDLKAPEGLKKADLKLTEKEQTEIDLEEQSNKKKRKRAENDQKKSTIGEIASNIIEKSLEKTLELLLKVAQMLLMAILLILRAALAFIGQKISPDTTLPFLQYPTKKQLQEHTAFIPNMLKRNNRSSNPEPSNDNDLEKNDGLDIKDALDENTEKLQVADKDADHTNIDTLDVAAIAKAEIDKGMSIDEKNKLDQEVDSFVESLNDNDKLEFLNSLEIPVKHKLGENLQPKISSHLIQHPDFGVLLAKSDLVELPDGVQAGVLSAYSIGDALLYAVAHEGNDKNYKIDFISADDLKLLKHNGVTFDNEVNLINQANEYVKTHYPSDDYSIGNVELLDYSNPSSNAITGQQFVDNNDLIDLSKIQELQPIDIPSKYMESRYKKVFGDFSPPQQHLESVFSLNKDHGQTHGFYGKILDLNDLVSYTANNGSKFSGAITAAYSHDNELYYRIKTSDDLEMHIPAKKTTLLEIDGGHLDSGFIHNQMYDSAKNKTALLKSLSFSNINAEIVPLSYHTTPDGYNNLNGIVKGINNNSSLINKPLSSLDTTNQQIYSIKNGANVDKYVAVGHMDDDGISKLIGVKISSEKNPSKSINQAKFIEINPETSNIKLDSVSNPKLKQFIDDTLRNHNFGQLNTQNTLLKSYSEVLEKDIDKTSIKQSLYKNKAIAAAILLGTSGMAMANEQGLELTGQQAQMTNFGFESNLKHTTIDDHALINAVNNLNINATIPYMAADKTEFSPTPLFKNDFIDGSLSNGVFNTLQSLIIQAKQDVLFNGYAANGVLDLGTNFTDNTQNPTQDDNEMNVNQSENQYTQSGFKSKSLQDFEVNKLKFDSNAAQIAGLSAAYMSGDIDMAVKTSGVDLLLSRKSLDMEWDKIQSIAIGVAPEISQFISGISTSGITGDISINDLDGLKQSLGSSEPLKMAWDNLISKCDLYQNAVDYHLDKVESKFNAIGSQDQNQMTNPDDLEHSKTILNQLFDDLNNLAKDANNGSLIGKQFNGEPAQNNDAEIDFSGPIQERITAMIEKPRNELPQSMERNRSYDGPEI